ncbi:MAG: hypothetical protein JRN15_16115 [Nitrososphaerota archaeon]|nr:hypothetical protein [Nitrososphaerota archaeon]
MEHNRQIGVLRLAYSLSASFAVIAFIFVAVSPIIQSLSANYLEDAIAYVVLSLTAVEVGALVWLVKK